MEVILFLIIVITYFFWSIIGLIIWIPLLFRVVAVYSFSIVYSAIVNPPVHYIKKNERQIKKAIGFYSEGFITIHHLWQNRNKNATKELEDIEKDEKLLPSNNEKQSTRFGMEMIWTIIFWISVLFLIRYW